ncbi:alpha-glucan family phosphorylase [Candidatus Woesearchaeota archaeon]|nr:alpha-glucan family phosphorylase [Candidatus Woesearchaeota archaeon]
MKHYLEKQEDKSIRSILYFSMEIGLDEKIHTYSGGLGVLAGDTIKTFADLIVPVVAITLVSRKGYFEQQLRSGQQTEQYLEWHPEKLMKLMPEKIVINLEGRDVVVQAWEYKVKGIKGFEVPVYFLDTNLPENNPEDQRLTDHLYGGDSRYRIKQEAILGIGGVRMIDALGYRKIRKYHMNEGHSAFLTLELLRETDTEGEQDPYKKYDVQAVKDKCVFTTHTPVPAGHDQFHKDDVNQILGNFIDPEFLKDFFFDDKLNMTLLALSNSEYINGVAQKHTEVSKSMFPGYAISSITNGVHSNTWTSDEFKKLYDTHMPGWREDPYNLRYALSISRKEIWDAHLAVKKKMVDYVNSITKAGFNYETLTLGFARRSTPYKRADLIFHDINKLLEIHNNIGKIQIVMAGKAHPKDGGGKDLIKRIFDISKELDGKIKVVYLENYDMQMAKIIISGVDVWMNTPRRPLEASGTSGMKAAHNGVPHFSILDGWWIEGHVENVTGWSIGRKAKKGSNSDELISDEQDAEDLYLKLGEVLVPMFYDNWDKWTEIMRHSIAFNASFFNTHRMVHQYVLNSYFH